MKKFFILLIISLLNFLPISSEETINIIYKINKNIITNNDIQKEIRYLSSLNANISSLEKKQVVELATQSLIRELIKKDEIEKFYKINYDVPELEIFVEKIYKNLNIENSDEFKNYLSNFNLTISDIRRKLAIEQSWNKLIYDNYKDRVKIDKKKIDEELNSIIQNKSALENYNLIEIMFAENNKDDFEKKFQEIKNSITDIGFEKTAIIHSISDSAKFGGKIGWINEGQLSKNIYDEIRNLKIGEFTKPLNANGGTILLFLNDKKIINAEINKEEELRKISNQENNRQLNEFSLMHFKKVENKSYVKKF